MCVQRVYRGHLGRAAAAAVKRNKQRGVLQYSSTDNASAIVTAHELLMLQLTRQVRIACRLFLHVEKYADAATDACNGLISRLHSSSLYNI
jgi:hypothetical protein